MDAGWPNNPNNGIICILCKAEINFYRQDPEMYFRHLIREHCAFYNLNLLLDLSLAQPASVSQETRPMKIKQERTNSTSNIWNYSYKGPEGFG